MNSICEIMLNEHRNILKMLDLIEPTITALEEGGEFNQACYSDVLQFLKGYADNLHHTKEEEILFFRIMAEDTIEKKAELKRLMHQHILSRGLFEEMEIALSSHNGRRMAILLKEYIPMIRGHIEEEDTILFPMLERILPEKVKNEVVISFNRVDENAPIGQYMSLLERVGQNIK